MFSEVRECLGTPVDEIPFVLFRFLFGLTMAIHTLWSLPSSYRALTRQDFFVAYEFAPWNRPRGRIHVVLTMIVVIVASLGLAFGVHTRLSATVFCLSYAHFVLFDFSLYNNHYYLIFLFGLLFGVCVPEPSSNLNSACKIPYWYILIFQLQLAVVYTYGGINKINADWLLRAAPMRRKLANLKLTDQFRFSIHRYCLTPWLGEQLKRLFRQPATAYFVCWGGMIFDLTVIWLMMVPNLFPFALPFFLAFHLFNHWLYRIGAFPSLNYASVVLFMDSNTLRTLVGAVPCP